MKQIGLNFDVNTIVGLLGQKLYDSPYAMLRENVQNAFDAIKERISKGDSFNPKVDVYISDNKVVVTDNGIGMDENNLEHNYWAPGCSGKNTEEAQKAGVVGHFGIGALANFGICSKLEVDTHKVGSDKRYKSVALKDALNEKSITIDSAEDSTTNYGTVITATLSDKFHINLSEAKGYLEPFVRYVDIPIVLNGENLSQKPKGIKPVGSDYIVVNKEYTDGYINFMAQVVFRKIIPLLPELYITNIKLYGKDVQGDLYLHVGKEKTIMGLHSGFGLSNMPVQSAFGFCGHGDFNFLQPTAGREAVSRENVQTIQDIVNRVEKFWAELISNYEIADHYTDFLNYLRYHFSVKLASRVKIACENIAYPEIQLCDIKNYKDISYYRGQDKHVIASFKTSHTPLLKISPDNPRKYIQLQYLQATNVKEKLDQIEVIRTYDTQDMDLDEYMTINEIKKVIEDDYILSNFGVQLADINLGVKAHVQREKDLDFVIYIAKDFDDLQNLYYIYHNEPDKFTAMVKDFVRLVLYHHFADYIPKDQRERAAAIDAVYKRRREKVTIRKSEVDSERITLYNLFKEDKLTADEFIQQMKHIDRQPSQESVSHREVGDVESVVKTATLNNNTFKSESIADANNPQPPILELDNEIDKKILTTDKDSKVLHNHKMFICLSDNMNRDYRSFFALPHYTKVIWSTHRIIYIFTDETGKMSLYYEMELTKKLPEGLTGGMPLVSTTIITDVMVYVPIPSMLYGYFSMEDTDELTFYVNFDKVNG